MKIRFYQCEICGKILAVLSETDVPTICCGKEMKELVPGTQDGLSEKHVPVVAEDGDSVTVKIGSVPHPMEENHHILWIGLRTAHGFQWKETEAGQPEARFRLASGDCWEAAYALCDLHGLWVREKEECK